VSTQFTFDHLARRKNHPPTHPLPKPKFIHAPFTNNQDGAAAVVVWLIGDLCVVANVGDAKAVLARAPPPDNNNNTKAAAAPPPPSQPSQPQQQQQEGGAPLRALTLTKEHLAIHAAERARIVAAGGFVSKEGRLNGRIQVWCVGLGGREQ